MSLRPPEVQTPVPLTLPAVRDAALHALSATLEQLPMNGAANLRAQPALEHWLRENDWMGKRDAGFASLLRYVRAAVEAGWLAPDDIADLCSWCDRLDPRSRYHHALFERVRELHGLLAEVPAEQRLGTVRESLDHWTQITEAVGAYWPLREVRSIVAEVVVAGRITQKQHDLLLAFTANLERYGVKSASSPSACEVGLRVAELCGAAPELRFERRTFYLVGTADEASASVLATEIAKRGGRISARVGRALDYLVICDAPDAYWAFAAYGRKVEQALDHRRAGAALRIVHSSGILP